MVREPYTLSIAVITRNRPDSLRRALRSIRAQSVQPFEILVGDDSDPEKLEASRQVAEEFGCRHLPPDDGRGMVRNRNRLARAFTGTHLRTMDDDHEFPPGHLEQCLRSIASDSETVWFSAEHLDGVPDPWQPPFCPGHLNARGFAEIPSDPRRCWAISDGATIFPRSVYERGQYCYDEFPFGSAFMEYGSRLAWLGYRIRVLEDSYVIHHNNESHLERNSVWYGSKQVILSSRLYAAFCHSFIYQPTWRNQALTVMETLKSLVFWRGTAVRALRKAVRAYRTVKTQLPAPLSANRSGSSLPQTTR